jgi:NAD(P)-dependent dehydrogenase (short-subunit alcohol dehydrogenase family)
MTSDFSGQTALILGGSSGIGLAAARLVLERGGTAILVGRDAAKLGTAVDVLSGVGPVRSERGDLTDRGDRERLIAALGTADLLVNAAGVFLPKPFLDHDEADYDRYLAINKGLFFVTQAVARGMAARGTGGAIVNVGSMWARQAVQATPSSAYSMAKAGLHAMTQHLAMELAAHRIRVNAVSPAVVETPIYEASIPKAEVHAALQGFNGFHPIGRVGRPEDVAEVIAFLLSPRAAGSPARSGTSMAASWPAATATSRPGARHGARPVIPSPADLNLWQAAVRRSACYRSTARRRHA